MLEKYVDEVIKGERTIRYHIEESLFCGRSAFQKVEVVQTKELGKMLFNDDLVMLSEKDEFIYHDMISHIALFTHPNPKKVLVIGGGDGGTLREVLRHTAIEKCTMVEIDEMVVNACKEFIPLTSSSLSDPRAELIIDDGVQYVAETKESFDIVLVDSTDPIGPATPLFGEAFYKNVYRILNEDGIVVCQGESPYYFPEMQQKLCSILSTLFEKNLVYNYSNMTYPGADWSFLFASKGLCPVADFDSTRVEASGLEFKYYNPQIHRASFAIPNFQRQSLRGLLSSVEL